MAKQAKEEKEIYHELVASNNKARHDFFVEETVEAGIELHGSEVKSLRMHRVNFADSYARVYENECFIIGLQLEQYAKTSIAIPEGDRRRKLLLSRREIEKLRAKTEQGGRTLVPLEIYFKGRWAKVKLGVCKGKTHGDKRQSLKAAEVKRDIDRALRNARSRR